MVVEKLDCSGVEGQERAGGMVRGTRIIINNNNHHHHHHHHLKVVLTL